ncbi:hypothetical protein HKBW3S43_01786 [Candidatus Hakubella thermalkaliphila]|uniref:Uncharacterized protein n=1 Tax=Candidatus Hakubella thermalkaliphila TaxID=2754717 RepID=A0A6V8P2B2_9ACTN|nr:hypothetical protein [Candidatus Hakubella thermalkaliphila]GFP24916.1 hypothetical protein HKBW3S25_00354 [Candidatus Hakubella thermalkaliphila]GFP28062.1 hypothetical protein HKBW3S33_01479 [Candidatus Hakubella thermalkaliphila]GFP35998.1 hypothetical protein HKBW3S43_01786 [Candidatus Hakubella thermalkaliphila]GFP41489.1 hypothetical protein HKBW3C_00614 [Candidatus Hakubella thermalkaliphila]
MKKEKILKEDGRYLIFYSLRNEAGLPDHVKESKEREALSGLDNSLEKQILPESEEGDIGRV